MEIFAMFCFLPAPLVVSFAFIVGLANDAQSTTCDTRCDSHHRHELIVHFEKAGTTCTGFSATLPLSDINERHPKVTYCNAEEDKLYTLMMIDPDAPSHLHPTMSPWLHWLVVNIPGSSLITGQIHGDLVEEYAHPTPPLGTGYHHYKLFLYQQEGALHQVERITQRANFDYNNFVENHNLGKPIAKTGFWTEDTGN